MKLYSEIAQDYGKAKFQSRKPIKKIITLKNIHENVNQVTKGGLLGIMLKKKKIKEFYNNTYIVSLKNNLYYN